jgi:hypothetical protein
MKQSIEYADVLRAINNFYISYRGPGLCAAFQRLKYGVPVTEILTKLGGEADNAGYFWPRDEQGRAQRLMMLAFMLTWLEDTDG